MCFDTFESKRNIDKHSFVATVTINRNLKNFYASLKSGLKIRFSVPNALDTSSISSGTQIILGFESSKSVILPKAALAID